VILLDTDACIAALNARPQAVGMRIAEAIAHRRRVSVSTIGVFELWYGIAKSAHVDRNMRALDVFLNPLQVLTFDFEDGRIAGDIRARLERNGRPIGPYDYLIAAQAIRHNLTLITANQREFSRVPGLRLENWATS
jgi:tRNA(fMet)-specific endonuclease VapC